MRKFKAVKKRNVIELRRSFVTGGHVNYIGCPGVHSCIVYDVRSIRTVRLHVRVERHAVVHGVIHKRACAMLQLLTAIAKAARTVRVHLGITHTDTGDIHA